jgi:bacteriocin-like protein
MAEKKLSEKEMKEVKGGANVATPSASVIADEAASQAFPSPTQPVSVNQPPAPPIKPV